MSTIRNNEDAALRAMAERHALTVPAKHPKLDHDGDPIRVAPALRPDIMAALMAATPAEFGQATMDRRDRRQAEVERSYSQR